jgi:putative transposase
MCRGARNKAKILPHHIISRGMDEAMLFIDNEDKQVYMEILRNASIEYYFEIIAYCLMDTHLHLLIHPRGADISRFMGKINHSYARYYNKKYCRRGHVFMERFKNIVIESDHQFIRTSTYIHCNPKDLKGCISINDYPFSSLHEYLGQCEQKRKVVSKGLLNILSSNRKKAIRLYRKLIEIQLKSTNEISDSILASNENKSDIDNEKKTFSRDSNMEMVIEGYKKCMTKKSNSNNSIEDPRSRDSILVLILRIFCEATNHEIVRNLKNIGVSMVSKYIKLGINYLENHHSIVEDMILELNISVPKI